MKSADDEDDTENDKLDPEVIAETGLPEIKGEK